MDCLGESYSGVHVHNIGRRKGKDFNMQHNHHPHIHHMTHKLMHWVIWFMDTL